MDRSSRPLDPKAARHCIRALIIAHIAPIHHPALSCHSSHGQRTPVPRTHIETAMARAPLLLLPLLAMLVVAGPCQAFNLKGLINEDWMLWGLKYAKWLVPQANTLAELAQQAPGNMSMLINAVQRADLQPVLANPETTITVLAPTNRAFTAALLKLKLTPAQLYADKTALTNILSFHTIKDQAVTSDQLKDGQEFTTVNNHKLKVVVDKIEGTFIVGGEPGKEDRAKILVPDLKGGKSVVHVIDTVLLPPPAPTAS